jgi:hypothetical protein
MLLPAGGVMLPLVPPFPLQAVSPTAKSMVPMSRDHRPFILDTFLERDAKIYLEVVLRDRNLFRLFG